MRCLTILGYFGTGVSQTECYPWLYGAHILQEALVRRAVAIKHNK